PARVTPSARGSARCRGGPASPPWLHTAATPPGCTFWFSSNTFVGSYRSFSATSRAYVSSLYAERPAPGSPRKFEYASPVDASDAPAITLRAQSRWAWPAPGSCQPVTALSTYGIDRSTNAV